MPDGPDHSEYPAKDNHPPPSPSPARAALADFRRRVDNFWSHPSTAELSQRLSPSPDEDEQRALPPSDLLSTQFHQLLESRPDVTEFRLQKRLTYRGGQLTSILGDGRPLAPDDRILIVTTTTTIMDSSSLTVETDLLMFERGV
jgi:hypothetical protein